jgi:coenzyme F420-reducing hydrogenase beta subunit
MDFKELFVYVMVGASSLFLSAFVVHMMAGGMVTESTEYTLMGLVDGVVALVLGYMALDVYRRRRGR